MKRFILCAAQNCSKNSKKIMETEGPHFSPSNIDMQVMHESTMILYIFRNGSINKVLARGTVEKGLDSLEVKRIGEGRDTKYTFASITIFIFYLFFILYPGP